MECWYEENVVVWLNFIVQLTLHRERRIEWDMVKVVESCKTWEKKTGNRMHTKSSQSVSLISTKIPGRLWIEEHNEKGDTDQSPSINHKIHFD